MEGSTKKREHLYDLLKDFDTAMMVTQSGDGHRHARPMQVAELRAGADAYFLTAMDSPKAAELEKEPEVTLTFQSARQFASVCGRATVVRDQAIIDRLWNEAWKVWFPKGKTDPNLGLIRFDAEDAEYWDNAGMQGIKYAFEAVKAYASGETPKVDASIHGKVKL